MTAQGIGTILAGVAILISLLVMALAQVKQARDSGIAWGEIKTIATATEKKLDKIEEKNTESHSKLFESINTTCVEVAKIGTTVAAINGTVKTNSGRITALEKDVAGKIGNPLHRDTG